jgi:hypothetical protein
MHSHLLLGQAGLQLAGIGRRLARRADAFTAASWQAQHRHPRLSADWLADQLHRGRAPEETYRDYMFRQSIWP